MISRQKIKTRTGTKGALLLQSSKTETLLLQKRRFCSILKSWKIMAKVIMASLTYGKSIYGKCNNGKCFMANVFMAK